MFGSLFFNDLFLDAQAAKHFSEGLKQNKALTSLKYAASHCLPTVSTPRHCDGVLFGSLRYNRLNAEAAKHLSEGLKQNKVLTSLEYAASHCT